MTDRGQTAYDYLLGIVLLLVTIITVLSLFPQVFGPFVDPVSTDQDKMADRMATEIIDQNSTLEGDRTLDLVGINETYDDAHIDRLKRQSGVPEIRNVHVTIQASPTDPIVEVGDQRRSGQPTATTVRQIRAVSHPEGTSDCTDGCQLIVRVW